MDLVKYILSQTPRVLMGIFLFCLLSVLIPITFLEKVGLLEIRNDYLALLWVLLFLSLSLLISHGLFNLFPLIKNAIVKKINRRKIINYLHNLRPEEKDILKSYIENDTLTKSFSMFSGTHRGLYNHGILYRASDISMPLNNTFDFNLSWWVSKYLKKNLNILE